MEDHEIQVGVADGYLSEFRPSDNTETNQQHLGVLLEAFDKFIERNGRYRDLWKKGGSADSLRHLRHKLERLEVILECDEKFTEDDLDEAVDIINYAVFLVRNTREGR